MHLLCKPLVEEGLLTEEPIRKYPLTLSNLHVVLKIYAIEHFKPYSYKLDKGIATTYYLTDKGLTWFYNWFKGRDLSYCRSLFSHLLIYANEHTLDHMETFTVLSNFRGTEGIHAVAGTKQKAKIIRTVKRCKREYDFDSIKEARDTLRIWLTQYPIEEFKLYRVRTQKGITFKEEIPLVVERSNKNNNTSGLLGGKK